uniref:Uncharacterized protein n=1 Tax=Cairina moschata TaxID=8855 RepID=A0A8C3C409_CAIMO
MLATLWVDHGIYIPYVSMVLQNDLCFLPRPFSKLQPAPVNYRAETPFQPDFDNAALRKYVHCQKIVRKPTSDWYNQTSYKAAFDLPYFSAGNMGGRKLNGLSYPSPSIPTILPFTFSKPAKPLIAFH